MPITIPTFAILLPITLPRIISPWSLAAAILAANSGVDVPYATTVIPIIILLIPNFLAMLTPPFTNQLPPKHNSTSPTIVNAMLIAISMLVDKIQFV